MTWNLACPDWADRLKSGRSLVPDLPISTAEGDRAVAVFNRLRLADVPGTPTLAEAGGDWFRDIVRALFGSLDPVTRARAIRELFLLVPKKNSKTTNGALLMLTALLLNQRPNASLIMSAPVQDVAQLAFDAAAGAIELDDVLKKKLHVREHLKTIVHRETKAELQIMTFDPATLTGQKPVAALIDELHVIARNAKAASAIRQLRGGMLPYPEAFMAFITTQSEEAPAGVFRAELMKARAIRDGKQPGAMLPVLYELPEEIQSDPAEWVKPEHWPMVTPNAGRSITIGRLVEDMATAKATSHEELRAWASQHLNLEIGLALMANGWAGAAFWQAAGWDQRPTSEALGRPRRLDLDAIIELSDVITVGIDGGGLDDMLGLSVIGRDARTGDWLTWAKAWVHRCVLERRKEIAPRLLDFERDGDLVVIDDDSTEDVTAVADVCEQLHQTGLLALIGVDPVGIGAILDELEARGIPREMIHGISQGWKMAGAIKTMERKLAARQMWHGGRPLMAWCVGNAKVEPRGNAILITKQAAGTAKIDPVSALINAAELMSRNPQGQKSWWDQEVAA